MSVKINLANKLMQIDYQDLAATKSGKEIHYSNRALYTYEAIALALQCGYEAGIRLDPAEPEWPAAFIELPTGQISYHLKQHSVAWDQHTTEQKRLRILEFVATVSVEGK